VIIPALIFSASMYPAYTYVETTLSATTVPASRIPPLRVAPLVLLFNFLRTSSLLKLVDGRAASAVDLTPARAVVVA